MRRFQFKFEAILKVRKAREDEALSALARAQRAHQAERERKKALQATLGDSLARREQLGRLPTEISSFQTEQDFITGTKQRIIQADQAITRANRGVEKALRVYLLARRQTRMIEVLREKAYADFKREENKREQRRMDDLTVMRDRLKNSDMRDKEESA